MSKINVVIDGEKYDFDSGITLLEISKKFDFKFPVLSAFIDNELFILSTKVVKDCTIRFLNVLDPVGNKIYQKGLLFVLIYAFKELFGYDYNVKACHSIDKSIMIRTNLKLNNTRINMLKDKMKEIIAADMPIEKCLVSRREARQYFLDINDNAKADTFIYHTNHYLTLYRLGDMYDYFFSKMPPSTSVFETFDICMLDSNSFVLQFPTIHDGGLIPPYVDHDKIIKTFEYSYQLSKRMDIFTISDFNSRIAEGRATDIIKLTEAVSSGNLLGLAKAITDSENDIKLVLIAGPSASGKTTTSRKLAMYLKVFGLNPKYLSIDDYFLSRSDTPKLLNGEYDFESINAIDTDLFNDHLKRIIKGEEVEIPTYNFYKGEKEYLGKKIKLANKDILIVEGLHAINEELTKDVPKKAKYKVYVSPLSDLNVDNHNMISNSDVRLLRRIARDNRTRGYSAEETISKWQNVRNGETQYIFPYQNSVDFVFNSSFLYEIGVLKTFVEPLLYQIDSDSDCYEEAVRLLNFLDLFVSVPDNEIPSDSIFREFIGGSYFE